MSDLRALAEAAKSDSWFVGTAGSGPHACNVVAFGGDDVVGVAYVPNEARRKFIADCDPQTVIALLDAKEAAERERDRAIEVADAETKGVYSKYMLEAADAVAENQYLRITLADAEPDAARYRWLRENWWNFCSTDGYPMPKKIGGTAFWAVRDSVYESTAPAELDERIDTAIRALQQTPPDERVSKP